MAEMPTREQAIATFAAMIRGIPVAMLTTTGLGRLRSRPMVTQREPFDGSLWFVTARAAEKTGEIRDRQAVHVTFGRAVREPVRLGVRDRDDRRGPGPAARRSGTAAISSGCRAVRTTLR